MYRLKNFAFAPSITPSVNAKSGKSRATAFAQLELGLVADNGKAPDLMDLLGGGGASRQNVSVNMEPNELRALAGMLTDAADTVEAFHKLVTGGQEVDTGDFTRSSRASMRAKADPDDEVTVSTDALAEEIAEEAAEKPACKKKETVYVVPGSGVEN
jgi:hypothetical protein